MLEVQPNQLPALAHSLPTGTFLFCYKPYVWHSPEANVCRVFRWGAGSDRYHHGAVIYWDDNGECCVVEAVMSRRIQPIPLSQWIQEREGQVIGVQPRSIDRKKIEAEFGKKYDKAALIAMAWYRVTGNWIGRTGTNADNKRFCMELQAVLAGLPEWWKCGFQPLEKVPA